ncbi:MAG: protein kinase [Rubripirellula sp.]|nr:protein kinase [Rubripirellula sp.]
MPTDDKPADESPDTTDGEAAKRSKERADDEVSETAAFFPENDSTFELETIRVKEGLSKEVTKPARQGIESPAPKQIASYEIVAELGRGGMGVVYEARDMRLKRTVALKVILAGGHAGNSELERFQTEAEAVARLKHPNIVQVYEIGEQDGRPFIALEYCSGGCLSDLLRGNSPSPQESARLVVSIADAMEHSHSEGVIHRDLKPGNILFDSAGAPKVVDFGLAKKLDEDKGHTRTGMVMGSLGYMSPEQASGKSGQTDHATDIYAIGAILYSLLSGQPPFQGASVIETLNLVIEGDVVPIRRLNPSCPQDLDTICLKCLQKSASNRYSSCAELAADLRRFLNGEPILARASTPYEQIISWTRRNPLPSLVAGVSVLMLAILSATFAAMAYRNNRIIKTIQERDMRVQELRGIILYDDEVLTNSCLLATLTFDEMWRKRYKEHERELLASIDEAVSLVPDAKAGLDEVNTANEELIQIETRAFEAVAQENRAEALDLLTSETYLTQKKAYQKGMKDFSATLKGYSMKRVDAAYKEAVLFFITALVFGAIVTVVFLVGGYSFIRTVRFSTSSID